MLTTILITVLVLFVMFIFISIWLKGPVNHKNKELSDCMYYIKGFLGCNVGSTLIMKHEKSNKFIKFIVKEMNNTKILNFVISSEFVSNGDLNLLKERFEDKQVSLESYELHNKKKTVLSINVEKDDAFEDKASWLVFNSFNKMNISEKDKISYIYENASVSKETRDFYYKKRKQVIESDPSSE